MDYGSDQTEERPLVRWNPRGRFAMAAPPGGGGPGPEGEIGRDSRGNCVICIESEIVRQTVCEQIPESICSAVGV